MPSWSGLHIWRTISSGHSSRSSRARSSSSGRRFFAKSLSDFKLNFKVFFAIMTIPLFRRNAVHFADFVGQFGQKLKQVGNDSYICYLEYGCLRVLVDGDQERIAFKAGQVLEGSTNAARQVDLRLDGFAGCAHL